MLPSFQQQQLPMYFLHLSSCTQVIKYGVVMGALMVFASAFTWMLMLSAIENCLEMRIDQANELRGR